MELLKYNNNMQKILNTAITNHYDLDITLSDTIKTMSKMDNRIGTYLNHIRRDLYNELEYSINEDDYIIFKDIIDLIEHYLHSYFANKKGGE